MRQIVSILFFAIIFCSCQKDVTLIHINDTHSHLFGSDIYCRYKGEDYNFKAGGLDLITQITRSARAENKNIIFLHAGDLIQGSRYFREFKGLADVEIMNSASLDAFVPGNHEFDKGHDFISKLLEKAEFPILGANIKIADEIPLKKIIKPYIITGVWPFRNGIIGITTPETAEIATPGKGVTFLDPAETVRKYIGELKKKHVRRIFVLSHLGFEKDRDLAENVEGIDVIIGGHSHTMLGFTGIDCLPVVGDYPDVVQDPAGRNVLIVQAWDHARAVGILDIKFDFQGEISAYEGKTLIPLRKNEKIPFQLMLSPYNELIYVSPDEDIKERFQNYEKSVSLEYSRKIGHITEELEHKWEKGSDVAPIVAEAILWKLQKENIQADIALQNAGGVRKALHKGEVTLGDISDAVPFYNNIVIFRIKGDRLIAAIKKSIKNVSAGIHQGSFPYLAGMDFEITNKDATNFSILKNNEKILLNPDEIYTVATDSYIAFGGNGYEIFTDIKEKEITTFIVSEIFAEYIEEKKEIGKPERKYPSVN